MSCSMKTLALAMTPNVFVADTGVGAHLPSCASSHFISRRQATTILHTHELCSAPRHALLSIIYCLTDSYVLIDRAYTKFSYRDLLEKRFLRSGFKLCFGHQFCIRKG